MNFYFIFGYIGFVSVLVYTLLCGDSDFHRHGLVGKLHKFLTSGLFICFKRCCTKIVGERGYKKIQGVEDVCCNRPNPFMQGFYVSLILGGYYLFLDDAFRFIKPPYMPEYYRWGAHIGVPFTLLVWLKCSMADPGIVKKSTEALYLKSFPYDDLLYGKKMCDTCKVVRPARSKHCRICNQCVSRFDHHCPWVNNCVGERNVRWFLSFLFTTALLCTYEFVMSGKILYEIARVKELHKMGYMDRATRKWTPAPYSYVLQYLLFEGGLVLPLGVFCFVLALVLYAFWGYHVYLVFRNTTTNETYKWKDVHKAVDYMKTVVMAEQEDKKKEVNEPNKKGATKRRGDKGDKGEPSNSNNNNSDSRQNQHVHGAPSNNPMVHRGVDWSTLAGKKIVNIYNKGFFGNIWEVIYPPSSRNKYK